LQHSDTDVDRGSKIEIYNRLKAVFPNIYIRSGKLVLPGISFMKIKEKCPDISMELLFTDFSDVSDEITGSRGRIEAGPAQAGPDLPGVVLPEAEEVNLDWNALRQRSSNLTIGELRAKFGARANEGASKAAEAVTMPDAEENNFDTLQQDELDQIPPENVSNAEQEVIPMAVPIAEENKKKVRVIPFVLIGIGVLLFLLLVLLLLNWPWRP